MKKLFTFLTASVMAVLLLVPNFSLCSLGASLSQVSQVKSYNIDEDEINLKWSAVSGATGYRVYMLSGSGKWKRVATVKKTKAEIDDLASAKSYKFKVRAYKKTSSGTVYGPYSEVITSVTKPDEPDNLRIKSKSNTSITLQWSPVKRATRYQIFFYDSQKGKFVRKKTVKGTSAKITGLTKGTSYKIKIRAYSKVSGKKYYSSFTDVISVKTSGVAATASSSSTYITKAKAKTIALNHAGLKENSIYDYSCSIDNDYGIRHYEIEFTSGGYDYEYDINASTGKIIKHSIERDD